MKTTALTTTLGLLAAMLLAASSPAASAAELVPPGNSAVNQYTETYPTAGGDATEGGAGKRSPAQALGDRNARRLEALGQDGRAAANLAAATTPARAEATRGDDPSPGGEGPGTGRKDGADTGPNGSSGLSEVLAQATGTSADGETGLLLPLTVLGAAVWAAAYAWRRRRRTA